MTAPEQGNKLTAAKALFIGFFAAALGWAGVLVAAVAVASEQTWSNGRVEGSRSRQRRAGWADTQRAWLSRDHQARTARAAQQREWLNAGADPDTKPAGPSWGQRLGAGLRRQFAQIAVAGHDFAGGFRRGWACAAETRRAGGSFRQIARSRPDRPVQQCQACGRPDRAAQADGLCAECATGRQPANREPDAIPAPDPREHDDTADGSPTQPEHQPTITPADQTVPPRKTHQTGDPRVTPTTTAPATESNATVLRAKLTTVNDTVAGMGDDVDSLATIAGELRTKTMLATELAHTAGMPTAAVVAVDAIQHATTTITARLDDFSTATATAEEALTNAVDGLAPVENAEEKLRAAGADGRVFDTTAA